jgi:glycosyltransferase involved in cell wall biosynthesis
MDDLMADDAPPTISVVTPCLNRVGTLPATMDSVLGQTGPFKLEYAVIDGGSTDGTVDAIRARADRLSYWSSEPDRGMYPAIAKGFAHTSGEIMAWLNSDDIYFPWTLSTVARIFREVPEVDWISSLTPMTGDMGGDVVHVHRHAGFSRDAFVDGQYLGYGGGDNPYATEFIQQESCFWRRRVFDKIDPASWTGCRAAGDFALWCQLYRHTVLRGVDAPLACFRRHEQQLSADAASYAQEAMTALQLLRAEAGWQPRDISQPHRIYVGLVVMKDNPRDPASRWKAGERQFVALRRSDIKQLIYNAQVF